MPGSTNFVQWNPGKANQETDSAYASDAQRAGGAAVGAAFPSPTANKLFYQVSTGVAALMQMLATKGFNVSDANYTTLASVLAAIVTTADQRGPIYNVAYSTTITLDASKYDAFAFPLYGNATIVLNGATPGQKIRLVIVQDGTGNRTVTYPSNFVGVASPCTQPSSVSVIPIIASWAGDSRVWPDGPMQTSSTSIENTIIGLTNPQIASFLGTTVNGNLSVSGTASINALVTNNETVNANLTVSGLTHTSSLQVDGASSVPTQSTADNSASIANTAFVQALIAAKVATKGNNVYGYWAKDPVTGIIRQWGKTGDPNGGTIGQTFPLAPGSGGFTTLASISVNLTSINVDRTNYVTSLTTSGFTAGNNGSSGGLYWEAVGY